MFRNGRSLFMGILGLALAVQGSAELVTKDIELAPTEVKVITVEDQKELGLTGQSINVAQPEPEGEEIVKWMSAEGYKEIVLFPRREGRTQLVLFDEAGAQARLNVHVTSTSRVGQAAEILREYPSISVTASGNQGIVTGVVSRPEDLTRIQTIAESLGLLNMATLDTTAYDDALRESLEERLNMPGIELTLIKGKAILEGAVPSEVERTRAEELVKAYFPVVNMLTVHPEAKTKIQADQITSAIGIDGVYAKAVEDKVILEGSVLDALEADRATAIASSFVPIENIINNVLVNNPMIEMDVIIADINWTDVKGFGSNSLFREGIVADLSGDLSWDQMFSTNKAREIKEGIEQVFVPQLDENGNQVGYNVIPINYDENPNNLKTSGHSTDKSFSGNESISLTAQTALRAFVQAGCAKILSQPHVSVRSGEEAYIQVGGDFGVPVVTQNTTSVEYKPFGTIVTIRPVVRKDGKILTHIEVERSSRPEIAGFGTVNQARMRTYSDILSHQGETVVLSGLIEEEMVRTRDKTPLLHRIPVANLFFKETNNTSIRSELVVLVTPTSSTLFESGEPPLSQTYAQTMAKTSPTLDDLSDQSFIDFLLNCEPDEWPCRGCGLPTCRVCTAVAKVRVGQAGTGEGGPTTVWPGTQETGWSVTSIQPQTVPVAGQASSVPAEPRIVYREVPVPDSSHQPTTHQLPSIKEEVVVPVVGSEVPPEELAVLGAN